MTSKWNGRRLPVRRSALDDGDRHQDAEPAVIAAAIADRVVVRAGDERPGHGIGRRIAADDVADRVDMHGHAGRLHPVAQLRRGRPVRRRQIGAGQAAGRVRPAGQALGHGHDLDAERGLRG